MKKLWVDWDERSEQVAGKSAMIALGLTRLRWGSSCLSDFMC